jgi:hypothetical protein
MFKNPNFVLQNNYKKQTIYFSGDRFYQYHLLTVLLIVISMPGASYGILTFFDAKVSISLYPWIICAILEGN